jgi:hypothetical protein
MLDGGTSWGNTWKDAVMIYSKANTRNWPEDTPVGTAGLLKPAPLEYQARVPTILTCTAALG